MKINSRKNPVLRFKKMFEKLKIIQKQIFSINNFDNHLVIYFLGFRIRKKLSNKVIEINLKESGINNANPRTPKIILSLTTFPDRINSVSKTIKTLLNQTLKPDKVILWLAFEQFPKKEQELPKDLLELKNFGLDIKWCEDIKSYKKLIPSLIEFPNDIIITFDDDIYYPFDTVEKLYNSYLKNPDCIHTNRAKRFYIKNNTICAKKMSEVYWTKYQDISYKNAQTGCGGVLYPPKSLNPNVLNKQEFMSLIPTHDDIWFWLNAILNNTKIKVVSSYDISLITIEDTQKYGLSKINNKNKGLNALAAARLVSQKYNEIIDRLKKEA